MKTTIIFAHPWHGSFNKSILDSVIEKRTGKGDEITLIDLYKDGFQPVLSKEDLSLFSRGETNDPQVKKYQEILKQTDYLIFIFPIWWYDLPAMLKGFIDRVMLKDFAYEYVPLGLKGLLTHISQTSVITTAEIPRWYLKFLCGDPIKKKFIKSILKGSLGIGKGKWYHNWKTSSGSKEHNQKFLEKLKVFI